LSDSSFTRNLDPRGFWRIDSDLPAEQRLTNRVKYYFKYIDELWDDSNEKYIQKKLWSKLNVLTSQRRQIQPDLLDMNFDKWKEKSEKWSQIIGG